MLIFNRKVDQNYLFYTFFHQLKNIVVENNDTTISKFQLN